MEDAVLEDQQGVIETENVTVDVINDTVVVEINDSVVETSSLGAPFSQWCNDGDTFTFETEDGSIESVLMGVETYEGEEFCKGVQSQVMQTPMGEVEITTTYYISESQREYWVVSNVMGQETKTFVTI